MRRIFYATYFGHVAGGPDGAGVLLIRELDFLSSERSHRGGAPLRGGILSVCCLGENLENQEKLCIENLQLHCHWRENQRKTRKPEETLENRKQSKRGGGILSACCLKENLEKQKKST